MKWASAKGNKAVNARPLLESRKHRWLIQWKNHSTSNQAVFFIFLDSSKTELTAVIRMTSGNPPNFFWNANLDLERQNTLKNSIPEKGLCIVI